MDEIAIAVEISALRRVEVDMGDETLRAHAYVVSHWRGQPVNAAPDEHDELGWFTIEQPHDLRLAHPTYSTWLPSLISDIGDQPSPSLLG